MTAGQLKARCKCVAGRSAGDVEVVADVDDAVGHLRGIDHRVVFGPGVDMAGQRDDAFLDIHLHVGSYSA